MLVVPALREVTPLRAYTTDARLDVMLVGREVNEVIRVVSFRLIRDFAVPILGHSPIAKGGTVVKFKCALRKEVSKAAMKTLAQAPS